MRTSLLASIAVVFAHVACGGAVDGVPSSSTTSPPASSTEPTPGASGGVSNGAGVTGNGPGSAPPAESCELACDEGHAIIQGTIACSPDGACYTRTICGKTIVCDGPKGLCEEPECLGYTQEVKACPAGSTCETQHLCDRTLICEKTDAQCDGLAACDEEDEEVASATECAKFASRCYSRAECGHRTYCVRGE